MRRSNLWLTVLFAALGLLVAPQEGLGQDVVYLEPAYPGDTFPFRFSYPDPGNPAQRTFFDTLSDFGPVQAPLTELGYVSVGTDGPFDIGGGYSETIEFFTTEDLFNLQVAINSGQSDHVEVVMKPGNYVFSQRVKVRTFDGDSNLVAEYVYPRLNLLGSPKDFVVRGESADSDGPTAKVEHDFYVALGAEAGWSEVFDDPSRWDEVRTSTQVFENISFDNYFVARDVGWLSTIIGQFGKVDLTFRECIFRGGGITLHTVGSATFEKNVMDDNLYGIELVTGIYDGEVNSTADADFFVSENRIRTVKTSIYINKNSYLTPDPTTTRTMEILDNEVQYSDVAGIAADYTPGQIVILGNNVEVVDYTDWRPFYGLYGSISLTVSNGALVKNNVISSSAYSSPWAGILTMGSSYMVAKSNKISGMYQAPLLIIPDLLKSESTSDFNRFIDNNLRKSTPVGWRNFAANHILLTEGTSNNIVKGSGAAGKQISALDEGDDNFVEGLE